VGAAGVEVDDHLGLGVAVEMHHAQRLLVHRLAGRAVGEGALLRHRDRVERRDSAARDRQRQAVVLEVIDLLIGERRADRAEGRRLGRGAGGRREGERREQPNSENPHSAFSPQNAANGFALKFPIDA